MVATPTPTSGKSTSYGEGNLERRGFKFAGGAKYTKEVDTGTHEDLVQDYGVNEQLTHGVKDTTQTVSFRKKKMQCPVQIDVDEEMQNARQTKDGTQLHNLAKFRVKKANEAGLAEAAVSLIKKRAAA